MGGAFDKLIPPVLGPLLSGMPHPQALSNEVNIIRNVNGCNKFPSMFVWRVPYVIQYSNTSASKEEGPYAY